LPIKRLKISNLRNLDALDLHPDPSLNIIYGVNGSGKTSVLEAIHLLAMGRSFRTHRVKPAIKFNADSMVLFSSIVDHDNFTHSVGIQRSTKGDSFTRIDGRAASSAAELASLLPVQLMDAHSFDLIEGPPKLRRSFLDWLVFHVEPAFYSAWKDYSKILKQRNSLLRRGRIGSFELEPWDSELCRLAEELKTMRLNCFKLLESSLAEVISDFQVMDNLNIGFYGGWSEDTELAEVLKSGLERDSKLGYTWYGAHKAEIQIKINGFPADQALSRGQQKLLICALKIAMGQVYKGVTGKTCVYLIDDLPSELDKPNQKRLASWLTKLEAQVFVTSVDKDPLIEAWPEQDNYSVFHVEHGTITSESLE